MAKIQTSVSVPVSSWADARNKIVANSGQLKAKVETATDELMVLKRGSQAKMRLLGGAFIKDTDLPIKAEIMMDTSNPGSIAILVSEHMVVGLTVGMGDKFQRACTSFAKDLVDLLS